MGRSGRPPSLVLFGWYGFFFFTVLLIVLSGEFLSKRSKKFKTIKKLFNKKAKNIPSDPCLVNLRLWSITSVILKGSSFFGRRLSSHLSILVNIDSLEPSQSPNFWNGWAEISEEFDELSEWIIFFWQRKASMAQINSSLDFNGQVHCSSLYFSAKSIINEGCSRLLEDLFEDL